MAACKSAEEKAKEDIQGIWKYTDPDNGSTQTYTFSDKNVTLKATNAGETEEMKGTFSISGSTLTLNFTTPATLTVKYSFSIEGKTLKLGVEGGTPALPFTKQ